MDLINEAINDGKRISFQYIDYNSRKKEVLRNKGNAYTVSPYSLIWNGDYYYLVGYYHGKEDIRIFQCRPDKSTAEILRQIPFRKTLISPVIRGRFSGCMTRRSPCRSRWSARMKS